MAKNKKEKKALMESYSKAIKGSKGFIVLKPTKLTPNETNEFRKDLFDFKANFNIVKNSIFKLALKDNNLPKIESLEKGENAIMFIGEDIVNPSKALKKFSESTKNKAGDLKIEIISGVLDKQLLTKSQVVELANMPSFEGSISMILGILDNAFSSVINVLEDPVRSYVSVIDQAFK